MEEPIGPSRLRAQRLEHAQASVEDIDYRAERSLDKRLIATLATGDWIRRGHGLLLTGKPAPARAGCSARSLGKPAARANRYVTPVDQWHAYLGEPTLADAILDRFVHRSHRVALTGPSMRDCEI